jgi:hypothetical protein
MTTLGEIKADVLSLAESPESIEIGKVAEIGIQETLKYISSKVVLPELVRDAEVTYAAASHNSGIAIGAGGFEVADFDTPLRLYVDNVAYDLRDYLVWKDLKTERNGFPGTRIYEHEREDRRPDRVWTLRYSDNLILFDPFPTEGTTIELVYIKPVDAYADANVVFLPNRFEGLVMNGALVYCKEYIREPEQIINPYQLLSTLDPQIQELKIHRDSTRPRFKMRIGKGYELR